VDHVYDLVDGSEIVSKTLTGNYDAYIELPTPAKNSRTLDDYGNIRLNNAEFEYQDDSELYYDATVSYTYDRSSCWKDSSGNIYGEAQDYYLTKDETLTAQWIEREEFRSVSLPIPVKGNYTFLGWSLKSNYSPGDSLYTGEYTPVSRYMDLYAVWLEETSTGLYTKVGEEWKTGPTCVKVHGVWKSAVKVFIKKNNAWVTRN
jgi:hypothetical protein